MAYRRFLSPTFYYTFGPHTPGLQVDAGDELAIVCPDSDNALADGTLLTPSQKQPPTSSVYFDGNPMAGPIYVRDAIAGDTLAVRIDAIELDRSYGQTGLAFGHGVIPQHLLLASAVEVSTPHRIPKHLYRWAIDTARGIATIANPIGERTISIPLDPFVGCIGTCPKWGQSISTLEKGAFGGNMDVPLTKPGSTVYLPVHCDGALLMMGDIHAAQGHGEIIGGGIETSGVIRCTIHVVKQRPIPSPRFRDATHMAATGVGGDILSAVQQAYAHLLDWIVDEFQFNRWDAYNLISQAGSIVVGGLSGSPIVVAAQIPTRLIEQ